MIAKGKGLSKRDKEGRRRRRRRHTFLPETETVSIFPYKSSLILLNLIGLLPTYFPSISFHAFRKSSGSVNAMNPYFAYNVSELSRAPKESEGERAVLLLFPLFSSSLSFLFSFFPLPFLSSPFSSYSLPLSSWSFKPEVNNRGRRDRSGGNMTYLLTQPIPYYFTFTKRGIFIECRI